MKKIIFSTMIASLLAFVGCQNEELVSENNTDTSGKKVILTANIQGAADSRVALTPDTDENENPIVKVDWRDDSDNPEIFKVYNDQSECEVFRQTQGNNFEGTLPNGANRAYYGYHENRSYNLSSQNGTLNEDYILMQAPVTDGSSKITFEHKTAILKVAFKTSVGTFDNTAITQIVMDNVHTGSDKNSITVSRTGVSEEEKGNIYIFLPIGTDNYSGDTFKFTVTAGGNVYTGSLTIPTGKSIVAGNLYTATIALTEVTYCYLPSGSTFYTAVNNFLTSTTNLTKIKFIANPNWNPEGDQIEGSGAYMVPNGTTLEIRTDAEVFMFHADCFGMFLGKERGYPTKLASIVSIDFNNCVNTSNVTDMTKMFYNCLSLTSLDLSNFDTSNVTTMELMFLSCEQLGTLDLSNFVTSKLTNMGEMFHHCKALTSLNLSSFDTSKVTTMMSMFNDCLSLASLDLSNFDTSSVREMNNMFSSCSSLTSLNLSNFNTSNVTTMSNMFFNCKKLETLDLRSFTLDNIDYLGGGTSCMFDGVGSELTSGKTQIYVATPNPFEGKETNINAEYAVYVPDTP